MMFTKDDIICTDKYLQLDSELIAYIKTDVLTSPSQSIIWRGKYHTLRPAKIWITGHSDYPICEGRFAKFQHNCDKWFTINKDFNHDKLINLPIGITNNTSESSIHPIYGNTDIMIDVMSNDKNIQNLVYMNFNIHTYQQDRRPCFDTFKGKSWVTYDVPDNTLEGRKLFLQRIRNHKFVLCPRGNGVDTHRLWETLYMGSIPIVKRHLAFNAYTDLPILFIDDWAEVNEEMLNAKYEEITNTTWNLEKLKIGYWIDIIKNSAQSG